MIKIARGIYVQASMNGAFAPDKATFASQADPGKAPVKQVGKAKEVNSKPVPKVPGVLEITPTAG